MPHIFTWRALFVALFIAITFWTIEPASSPRQAGTPPIVHMAGAAPGP